MIITYKKELKEGLCFLLLTIDHCKEYNEDFSKISKEFAGYKFFDSFGSPLLKKHIYKKYNVEIVPLILIFENGELLGKIIGTNSYNVLKEKIEDIKKGEFRSDVEGSMSEFYNRIEEVMAVSWNEIPEEEWTERMQLIGRFGSEITEDNKYWRAFTDDDILKEVKKRLTVHNLDYLKPILQHSKLEL